MLRAFINWIKSLFSCFYPIMSHSSGSHSEIVPLMDEDELAQHAEEEAQSVNNTGDIIVQLLEPPVTPELPEKLTAWEAAAALHHARLGKNDFIDNLAPAKKMQAFALIAANLNHHIENIDAKINGLPNAGSYTHRIKHAWKHIQTRFSSHENTDRSLTPSCQAFKDNNAEYNTVIDTILDLYQVCKNIISLNIFRAVARENKQREAPSKEDIRREILNEEQRYNLRTLKLVDDFNKRASEPETKQPSATNRGYRRK